MSIVNTSDMPSRAASRVLAGKLPGGRRGLLVLGALALGLGAAFNWSWLVAAGVAPLLLAALPCVAMCALGLCMGRMKGSSAGEAPPTASSAATAADAEVRVARSCCSPTENEPAR